MKTMSKILGWQGFSLMKFCKCSKFKFFVRRDKFSRIAQIALKFAIKNYSKIQKLKNSWKTGTPSGKRSWKIGTPVLFACWHAKFNNWHTFGALAGKNGKLASGPRFSRFLNMWMPFNNIIIIMMVMIIIQRNVFLLYLFSSRHFVGWGVVGAGSVWAPSLTFVPLCWGCGLCGVPVSGFESRPIWELRGLTRWWCPTEVGISKSFSSPGMALPKTLTYGATSK